LVPLLEAAGAELDELSFDDDFSLEEEPPDDVLSDEEAVFRLSVR